MEIVVDTNVFLAVALNESSKGRIVEVTAEADAVAPEILPYEIGNALSAIVKRRQVSVAVALEAEKRALQIPVRLLPVDIGESLAVACKHGIYAYDAYFLQCARRHSLPLLTLDRQMQRVAKTLSISLVE